MEKELPEKEKDNDDSGLVEELSEQGEGG